MNGSKDVWDIVKNLIFSKSTSHQKVWKSSWKRGFHSRDSELALMFIKKFYMWPVDVNVSMSLFQNDQWTVGALKILLVWRVEKEWDALLSPDRIIVKSTTFFKSIKIFLLSCGTMLTIVLEIIFQYRLQCFRDHS